MTDKQQKMYALVESWEGSGMTQAAYCEQTGISHAVFSYWRSKYLREGSGDHAQAGAFMEVKLGGDPSLLQGEFIFPSGVRLQVRGMDLKLLRRLCLD
jgi:hypothetical protein